MELEDPSDPSSSDSDSDSDTNSIAGDKETKIGWLTGLAWVGEVQPRPIPMKPVPITPQCL